METGLQEDDLFPLSFLIQATRSNLPLRDSGPRTHLGAVQFCPKRFPSSLRNLSISGGKGAMSSLLLSSLAS